MPRTSCDYCGLPVAFVTRRGGGIFCCYGCSIVSKIVGGADKGPRTWSLLRLAVGALLAMNVMMLSILLYTGSAEESSIRLFRWTMLGLSTPAMLILGYPFVLGAASELRRLRLSLDTLIAVGAFTAFGVSAVNTIRGTGHIYFDIATMLPTLVTFGKLIEATAKSRVSDLVRGLDKLLPAEAARVEGESERRIAATDVQQGDLIRVGRGERIAADGRIESGATVIEESAFTGESEPRERGQGDAVLGGTVNAGPEIMVRVERVGGEMVIRRIVDMVEEARATTAPSERIAQRAAAWFIPMVFCLAAASGLYWTIASGPAKGGLVALAVLVVACPCAMGIATPVATALAANRAARAGAVVRSGDALESLGIVRRVFLDKTGTVTTDTPMVEAVVPISTVTENELLEQVAALESSSKHSYGRAIVSEAQRRGLTVGVAQDVEIVPGFGIKGNVEWRGERHEISAVRMQFSSGKLPGVDAPQPIVYVTWDGEAHGLIVLPERIRHGAAEAMRQLQSQGISAALLSGDRREAVEGVARRIGIDNVVAECPADRKVQAIEAARRDGPVAMVGDGINDAPALAAADVGIALGAGTDLARQAGNVLLVGDRLELVPWLVDLSRYTRRIIRQNLAWALGYNAVAMCAAAFGVLHPLLAALAMVVSSLTVLGNAVRVQGFPEPGASPTGTGGGVGSPVSVRT